MDGCMAQPDSYMDFDSFGLVEDSPRFLTNITNFNITTFTESLLNNTMLMTGGVLVVGIVLFEVALYALDVYYNQTYLSGDQLTSKFDGFDENVYYQDYPPYVDPFLSTYRSNSGSDFNLNKILSWIALLEEAWGLTNE